MNELQVPDLIGLTALGSLKIGGCGKLRPLPRGSSAVDTDSYIQSGCTRRPVPAPPPPQPGIVAIYPNTERFTKIAEEWKNYKANIVENNKPSDMLNTNGCSLSPCVLGIKPPPP
jgi:hypothetical protein